MGVDASSARYSIKQFDSENYDFEKSTKTVANMAPVVELKGNEFVIGKQGLYDEIVSYFNTINNNAYNEELGDVELKRRGIKDSVAHGLGELKTVAFRAIPSIIEKGKVVDYQKKWKGREYDTAVIAAPINIAGEEYYAVVVVRRTQVNQRFYLHEIDIKKRQTVQTEATTINNSAQELGGLPINSIFQKLRNVNTFGEKISKKSFEQQSTYVDSEGRELTKEQKDKYIQRKLETREILYEEKRNTQASESTAPIAANYGVNVSNTIIRENSEKSTENAKKDEKTSKNSSERYSLDIDSRQNVDKKREKALLKYQRKIDISTLTMHFF